MNRRYEHDPQPGELPEELKPRQKLDTVSEAIATEMERLTDLGLGGGGEHVVQGALHRIASLSYARGVEDSAMVCEAQKSKLIDRDTNFGMNEMARASLEDAAAAIRDLTHNEKKV